MRKILIIMVGTVISISLLSGCGKAPAKGAKKESAIPVKVMKVAIEDLDKALEYVGNIKGRDEAVVYPKVSGKIIEKVKEDGSSVSKGETIAYIDRDEVGLKFEKAPVESPLTGTVGRVYACNPAKPGLAFRIVYCEYQGSTILSKHWCAIRQRKCLNVYQIVRVLHRFEIMQIYPFLTYYFKYVFTQFKSQLAIYIVSFHRM